MSNSTRTQKAFLNIAVSVLGQILSFALSFVIRTVFIRTLGELYLGLNGLYTNILSVLNLTELGLGTAIVIDLYRTVATNDKEKTKQYLELYRRAYFIIGAVIVLAGLALMPFLHYFVNDSELLVGINYRLVFLLYLLNTTFSYFFFAYRQSILQANQEEYKIRTITYIFKIVEMLLQVTGLLIFKSIYLYLFIPIVLGCISTVLKGMLCGRWYPYIREKPEGKLTKEELRTTWRNIRSVAIYKVSGCVISSTDNIILSSFISIIITGLYSNYLVITSAITTLLEKLFSAFTAGLGNLNVEAGENLEKKHDVFKALSFLNFWLYGFCSVCIFVLFEPFIQLWLGAEYTLGYWTEFAIMLSFLINGLQETVGTHRAAYGLFYRGRYRPLFSITLNIGISILLVKLLPSEFGIVAVLLGTVLSNLLSTWWYDALILYKSAFKRSPKEYYLRYLLRMFFILAVALVSRYIVSLLTLSPLLLFFAAFFLCVVVFHVPFFLLHYKSPELRYFLSSGKSLLSSKLRH